MFCKNCGLELSPDTKFCPKCGTPAQRTDTPVEQEPLTNGYWDEPSITPAAKDEETAHAAVSGYETRGYWDESTMDPPPDLGEAAPQDSGSAASAFAETGQKAPVKQHTDTPQQSDSNDNSPPPQTVPDKDSPKKDNTNKELCPLCRGKGKIWVFSPVKASGKSGYHAHQDSCYICSDGYITTEEESAEAEEARHILRPFRDSGAKQNCKYCHGTGAVAINAKKGAVKTVDLYSCPACSGKPIFHAETKTKKKWTAFFLCLPFGFFVGAHKFYEGNTKKALTMFVLFWGGFLLNMVIPPVGRAVAMIYMIWWFIDLITILTRKSEYEAFTGKYIG